MLYLQADAVPERFFYKTRYGYRILLISQYAGVHLRLAGCMNNSSQAA